MTVAPRRWYVGTWSPSVLLHLLTLATLRHERCCLAAVLANPNPACVQPSVEAYGPRVPLACGTALWRRPSLASSSTTLSWRQHHQRPPVVEGLRMSPPGRVTVALPLKVLPRLPVLVLRRLKVGVPVRVAVRVAVRVREVCMANAVVQLARRRRRSSSFCDGCMVCAGCTARWRCQVQAHHHHGLNSDGRVQPCCHGFHRNGVGSDHGYHRWRTARTDHTAGAGGRDRTFVLHARSGQLASLDAGRCFISQALSSCLASKPRQQHKQLRHRSRHASCEAC